MKRIRVLLLILAALAVALTIPTLLPKAKPEKEPPAEPEPEIIIEDKEEPEAPAPFFPMTDYDRDLVERVVTAEAVGEPFEGQKAVAQCILETCIATAKTPAETVLAPKQYASPAPAEKVTASVREAVAAVFDRAELVTDEPIRYFYAPARCESKWHESLHFVIEIGGHRFFSLGGDQR